MFWHSPCYVSLLRRRSSSKVTGRCQELRQNLKQEMHLKKVYKKSCKYDSNYLFRTAHKKIICPQPWNFLETEIVYPTLPSGTDLLCLANRDDDDRSDLSTCMRFRYTIKNLFFLTISTGFRCLLPTTASNQYYLPKVNQVCTVELYGVPMVWQTTFLRS